MNLPFNKPYLTGKEAHYIYEAVYTNKHIAGNGKFTKKCQNFFEKRFGFKKSLLTTSCTDALEMSAILINTKEGDEIIMPSYTFVTTANAFVLRGAKIIFADSEEKMPNIDADKIEALITEKTKAIVVVHYAGVSCDMDKILALAKKYNLFVIEDAAQAIDSYYKGKPLGTFGHLATFSFHETKNIISGEGGMLVINDEKMIKRAEIIWEKGTNRAEFFRGEVDKYSWVDIGSSYLPSDIIAAYLYAQLEDLDKIQAKRKKSWNIYNRELKEIADNKDNNSKIKLPYLHEYATNNGHMFYLTTKTAEQRNSLISYLKQNNIHAVFHYLSLHKSPFYKNKYPQDEIKELENCDRYSETLVRLPMYYEINEKEIKFVCDRVKEWVMAELSHSRYIIPKGT